MKKSHYIFIYTNSMKSFFSVFLLFLGITFVAGQNITDALRYASLLPGGTARSVGAGGALGALGADYSVVSTNPAGLAAFRSSEMMFSPAIYSSKTASILSGTGNQSYNAAKSNFHFQNIGFVFNSNPVSSKWKTVNVALGYNRLATYTGKLYFEGNSSGTLVDRFRELAYQRTPEQFDAFEAGIAYEAGAIYDTDNDQVYESDFDGSSSVPVNKEQIGTFAGSISELHFAVAGNYDEKIMLGATIGVPFLSYRDNKSYYETDQNNMINYFNSMTFEEDLRSFGVGINLKLGATYRINQMFRIGAAFHTPTAFSLTDQFSNHIDYNYTDANHSGPLSADSPDGSFSYKLKTPWRAIGSAAILFDKRGFITAEVEWLDYTASSFNFDKGSAEDQDYARQLNDDISLYFNSAVNARFGGELAMDIFRFRAGYGLIGTPYINTTGFDSYFSLGAGIREKGFYLDVAYRRGQTSDVYNPYRVTSNPLQNVTRNTTNGLAMATLGFKF